MISYYNEKIKQKKRKTQKNFPRLNKKYYSKVYRCQSKFYSSQMTVLKRYS